VFWINVPVGLLLVVAVRRLVPPSAPEDAEAKLDLVGALLLVAAAMAVIVGASLIENPTQRTAGGSLAAAGLVLGTAFVAFQRATRSPLVPRAAFASANIRTGTVASFINTATTSSAGVLATLFLQEQLGASPVVSGLILMPFSLAVIAGAALSKPFGARLTARRLAAVGLAGIAAGDLLLAMTYGSIAGIVAGVVVAGAGLGGASVAATAIGTDVAETLSGTASGLLNTGAQLGTAIGVAALLVLAAAVDQPWPGTALAWGAAAAVAALSALILSARHRASTSAASQSSDRDHASRS
jgi:Na+/melibiose symporter-like transporter